MTARSAAFFFNNDRESRRACRAFVKALSFALALYSPALFADTAFEQRLQRAKRVEATADGKAYVQSMWKQIGAHSSVAMRECFRKGTQPDTPSFVLIANVLPDGTLSHVEAQPRTAMVACYLRRFADAPFPQPPEIFGDAGIPIVIEMDIKP